MAPVVAQIGEMLRVRKRPNSDDRLVLGRECNSRWSSGECVGLATSGFCGGQQLDDSYFGAGTYWDFEGNVLVEQTVPAGGDGAPDADFILLVTALNTQQCGGATLAYAGTCLRDDTDRPVAGNYNQCPTKLSTDPGEARKMRMVTMHEMFHAIAFASSNFAMFRNPETQEPYLPR